MKIKNLLLTALLFGVAVTGAQAQSDSDKPVYVANSYWSNWFVDAGVGVLLYFGDGDADGEGSRVAPAVNLSVGKWITPNIGLRVGYSGAQAKGSYVSTGEAQKWTYTNLHADVMFDAASIIFGYNEERLYSPVAYAGFGLVRNGAEKIDEYAASLGLQNNFRINNALSLHLDLKGTIAKDILDGEVGGVRADGVLAIAVGATYKFNPRGWNVKSSVVLADKYDVASSGVSSAWKAQSDAVSVVSASEINGGAKLDKLNAELDEAKKSNKNLRDQLADAKKNAKPQIVTESIVSAGIVFFEIGKSNLTKQNKVVLDLAAQTIKEDKSGKVYTIVGYADNATGEAQLNDKLSQERAEAVCKSLVEEFGVSKSQLKVTYKGGVDNMFFDDPKFNRSAIIE